MKLTKEDYQTFNKHFSPTFIIGEGTDGKAITINLKKIVHLLFGGQSGSGKSVFILQLIYQLLFLSTPESLQLILIDPLKVSFKDLKELPHLLTPVANSPNEAIKAIDLMIQANRERYEFLENIGFENIYDYNDALLDDKIPYKKDGMLQMVSLSSIPQSYIDKTKTENYELGKPMPQIVLFMDEFNALMLDESFGGKTPAEANTRVLKALIGVSEQARKAGILIIVGTQKIDAKSMPTKIRGNMKTRICLKVLSTDGSTAILGDTPLNKRDGSKLTGYGDGLVFNEDLNAEEAIRFQSAYVSHSDLLDLINGFVKAYGKNDFEYIKVNDEYATNSADLEPLPIQYEDYKDGLPDIVIVKDNVFLKPKYQKILTQLIKEPFYWDDKAIKLRYPSLSKDLPIIKQQLLDGGILAINYPEEEEGLEDKDSKKTKKDKKDGYLGLNLKLRGLDDILIKLGIIKSDPKTWDAKFNHEYQVMMMKLCLIHLNKVYNRAASKLSLDINQYI